jgi:D-sedoheptulose 7-phosphate isomerase
MAQSTREHLAAAAIDGRIFFAGGETHVGESVGDAIHVIGGGIQAGFGASPARHVFRIPRPTLSFTPMPPKSTRGSASDTARQHLLASADVKREAAACCSDDIAAAAALIAKSLSGKGKLLLCGNGGSAADAQHIAAEFVSVLNQDNPRAALAAIALTTDTSFLTANANDFGFENVFARQVEALGRPGDVLLGISTSGKSANVLRAVKRAKELGLGTVGFTGSEGNELAALVDVAVRAPSSVVQHIQETHIALAHVMVALIEESIFPG